MVYTVGWGSDEFLYVVSSNYERMSLSAVSPCSGLAAVLNAKFLSAAITHMHQNWPNYRIAS